MIDPQIIVEALKLVLSGDNQKIAEGEAVLSSAKKTDCYLRSLMIVANSAEVGPQKTPRFFEFLYFWCWLTV